MKVDDWNKIKIINDDNLSILKEGEIFLTGQSMINQKGIKSVGDNISYYKIIRKNKKSIEYSIEYGKLKK